MYRVTIYKIIVLCAILGTIRIIESRIIESRIIESKAINMTDVMHRINNVKFNNHQLFKIKPETYQQITRLHHLNQFDGYVFLKPPTTLNEEVILVVGAANVHQFYRWIDYNNANAYTLDVSAQDWVANYMANNKRAKRSVSFSFSKFHTLKVIYERLDKLARWYPKNVKTIRGGITYEYRDIKGVKLSFQPNKSGIFIEGGINSRNWISPAVVMYVLHQLLTSKNKDVRELAEGYDWYIFPVFNPDGYEYTHSSPSHRRWLKTRKLYSKPCIGANLNMNWDYRWNSIGARRNQCSIYYPGSSPLSEVEARSMSKYIKTISNKFDTYISINNNNPYILFPYGFTKERAWNYDELMAVGNKIKETLQSKYRMNFTVGSVAEVFKETSGSTTDYIYGSYGTRFVYVYPSYHPGGYMISSKNIIPIGRQTLDSFIAMFKEVKAQDKKRLMNNRNDRL